MNNFNRCCSAEEHDGRSEVSLQLVLGDALSMPMFFRAIRGALCHVLTGFFLANSSEGQKVDSSCVFLSSTIATRHYGKSQRKNGSINYIANDSQPRIFLARIGRGLIRVVREFIQKTSFVNISYVLKDVLSGHIIASAMMVDVDLKCIPVFKGKEATEICKIYANTTPTGDYTDCNGVNLIYTILSGLAIPSMKRNLVRGEHNQDNLSIIYAMGQIQKRLIMCDIEHHLAGCRHDIIATTVRVVESAAWRGIMFPIDSRQCRGEIDSGQFFHQGHDKENNPIFYFRNTMLGPWRCDPYGSVLSLLRQLETYLYMSEKCRNAVKITVIALLYFPTEYAQRQIANHVYSPHDGCDKRIDPWENFHFHSNSILMKILNELIPYHYPERLAKVLVVHENGKCLRHLSHLIVLESVDDLKNYVDKKELVRFAGGDAVALTFAS